MAWNQSNLGSAPIPNPDPTLNFNLHLTQTRLVRNRNTRATPLTWGDIKAVTNQAQRILEQQEREQNAENLVATVFAIITANSMAKICLLSLFCCMIPFGATHASPSPNMWIRHAQYMFQVHGTNATLYYEHPFTIGQMSFLPSLFNTPELVVSHLQHVGQNSVFSKPPTELNDTRWRLLQLTKTTKGLCFCCHSTGVWNTQWKDWKRAKRTLTKLGNYSHCLDYFWLWGNYNNSYSLHFSLANTTIMDLYSSFPMYFPNYTGMGSICSGWQIKDPNLWFFFNGTATNFHPGNYQCAGLGYLTLPVQVSHSSIRVRRDFDGPLGSSCCDEVITDVQLSSGTTGARAVMGVLTGVLTLGGYPGIIAQENRRSILGLTCRLEKTVSATGAIVRELHIEIDELHQDNMQVRFAIDYLLAKTGGFCKVAGSRGCRVHYHNLNQSIEDELSKMEIFIKHNVHGIPSSIFSWLTDWLPNLPSLKQIFFYGIVILSRLIICCCFIQCIPSLISLCHPSSPMSPPLTFPLQPDLIPHVYKQLEQYQLRRMK